MKTFSKFLEDANVNLQANIGQTVKNQVLQILNQPAYAQWKQAYERLTQSPVLYQNFLQDVYTQSNGTYNLTPAKWIEIIKKHSLKAAGTNLPPTIPTTGAVTQ